MQFRLHRRQSTADTLRDLGDDLLQNAADRLRSAEVTPDDVHRTRTAIKRVRTLRGIVAPDDRPLDRSLRDINRALSGRRDADVLTATWHDLASRASPRKSAAFVDAEPVLAELTAEPVTAATPRYRSLAQQMDRCRQQWLRREIDNDGWLLLAPAFQNAYRGGRRQWQRLGTSPKAADLHALRKRAKQLQYLLELLQPASRERLAGERAAVEALTDLLGLHHDLEVLSERLAGDRAWPSATVRQQVGSVLRRRQEDLVRRILRQAATVFTEKPRDYLRRLERYWTTWREAPALGRPRPTHARRPVKPR
jgi:CHAD domain-containing protein